MHAPSGKPVDTGIISYGKTESIELVVNGETKIKLTFDERTAILGDCLVSSIIRDAKNVSSFAEDERFNTYTKYSDGNYWFD